MAAEGVGIADDDDLVAGAGDGDIHAAQVAEETDATAVVGAHHGEDDDIPLLPLEGIDRVDGDLLSERPEKGVALDELAQQTHLRLVGRDDTEVDALVLDAVRANLLDVEVEGRYGVFRLLLIIYR